LSGDFVILKFCSVSDILGKVVFADAGDLEELLYIR
jgi:hypothetical protein